MYRYNTEVKITTMDFVGAPRRSEDFKTLAAFFDKSVIVSTKELAQKFEITERRVLQLVNEGFLYKVGRNQFNLAECEYNYVLYQKRLIFKDLSGLAL